LACSAGNCGTLMQVSAVAAVGIAEGISHVNWRLLYEATDINGEHHPIICKELYKIATNHKKEIEDAID